MSKNLMSIVVLNWNRRGYSKTTIENIIKKATVPHILTLVDNSSSEQSGVRDYLSSINKSNTNAEEVVHVFNKKNLGVAGGRNSGIWAVEQKGLKPAYLFNVDDDVLLPSRFDVSMKEICDKVLKVGVTGVSVEPERYPVVNLNGVKVQLKQQGNLNGAALCLPRRVFLRVGYYGFGRGTIYGHEDSKLRYAMDILGLLSVYILGRGTHLDTDKDKAYRRAKNQAHKKGSIQLRELAASIAELRKTKNVYTPYTMPEEYSPVDGDIFTNDLIFGNGKK
jgi:hypothetical protein